MVHMIQTQTYVSNRSSFATLSQHLVRKIFIFWLYFQCLHKHKRKRNIKN